MKQVHAHYNHARWIAFCPECNTASLVTPGVPLVCPGEYPGLLAKTLVPNPHRQGAFNAVADDYVREQARRSALSAGDAYEVIFPAEKDTIERVLRERPRHGRNWFPGVTVAELVEENERLAK